LDRLMLRGVRLDLDPDPTRQGAFGHDANGFVILIGASLDPSVTLYHESIHALRAMDLFTEPEWAALETAADDWLAKHDIPARYGHLDRQAQLEEAIAEEFGAWAAEQVKHDGPVARAFQKIRRFFRALREAFGAAGYPTAEDVFGRTLAGEVGARQAAARRAAEMREQAAHHGSPHDFDRFSLDAIGTGEGAQAFGWGLYFASRRAIADHYRKALSRPQMTFDGRELPEWMRQQHSSFDTVDKWRDLVASAPPGRPDGVSEDVWGAAEQLVPFSLQSVLNRVRDRLWDGMSLQDALADVERTARFNLDSEITGDSTEAAARIGAVEFYRGRLEANTGRLYTVDIPENDELLAWDKPLSDQPEGVRVAIASIADVLDDKEARMRARPSVYTKPVDQIVKEWTGADLYDAARDYFTMEDSAWDRLGKTPNDVMNVDQAASEFLRAAGIPGHRYADNTSRGSWRVDFGEGGSAGYAEFPTYAQAKAEVEQLRSEGIEATIREDDVGFNFVIYDDSRVQTLAKEQRPRDTASGDLFADQTTTGRDRLRDQAEIDARQRQSKMRRGDQRRVEDDPGSMFFDGSGDLFGTREQRAPLRQPTPAGRQALAMSGAAHIPDRRLWEELRAANRPIWARLKGGAAAAHDAVDRVRIALQDRFLPVLRAQEAIMRASGKPLPEAQNAYLAEETFSGKVGRHLFEIDEQFTKPIIDEIAEAKGLDIDQVDEWLYARHAIERNKRIASINDQMPDGGSGMSTADAQAVLDAASSGPHAARLERIGRLIDQLREKTIALREDAGLITPQEAKIWRAMYRHYVPLKGFAETDHSEATLDVTGVGRRFSIGGRESRAAAGRRSEAFSPLQAMLTQAQEVAIRAEKNRVGQALYRMVEANPSPMWEVKKPEQRRYFNRATGMVETRTDPAVSIFMDPNEMAVKIGGEEHRITWRDERLARAVGTVGADQVGLVTRLGMAFSRWFSSVNTMLNPEFVVTNAFRDMTAAQVNIQNFGEADRAAISRAMVRNWPRAFRAAYRGQGGLAANDPWTRHWREYEKAGGKVSFWRMDQPEAGRVD
ncbi:MAG TPA: hypothetical protein VFJ13_05265, partial [Paracoccaceae bacterium]|nr:hypothetical protein [Paracoccaceae bacterium]